MPPSSSSPQHQLYSSPSQTYHQQHRTTQQRSHPNSARLDSLPRGRRLTNSREAGARGRGGSGHGPRAGCGGGCACRGGGGAAVGYGGGGGCGWGDGDGGVVWVEDAVGLLVCKKVG
jgi:hypothetical protein